MQTVDPDALTEMIDPHVARAQMRVGQVLREKWRLDVLLGVGGMAAVYAATHRNGNRVAVKLLHPELSLNTQVKNRFLREGYVANAVGHEGAVRILDDDQAEDGSLFLVTELLDGETLEERCVRFGGRLGEDDALCLVDQLLDVLVAAHDKGVIHRDLKPENVFVTRSGQVKVLDFGIARLRELSKGSSATRSGASMGTPAYMPPEQARGLWDEVDARSDLWAVGATMFHLLSGQFVHDGRTANEQLLSAMTKPAPPLTAVAPDASKIVAHLVDRALAFERERRWMSAARMQEALRHAYHDRHGTPITTAPKLTVPPSVPNRTLATGGAPLNPKQPSTGQPVESASIGPLVPIRSRPWLLPVVIAVAAASGVGATLVVVSGRNPAAPAAASAPPVRASALPPIPSVAPAGIAPAASVDPLSKLPEIMATDLPRASAAATPARPPFGLPAVPPRPTPSAAAPATSATPPAAPSTTAPGGPPSPLPSNPFASPVPAAPPAPSCRTVFDHYDENYQPKYRQDCH